MLIPNTVMIILTHTNNMNKKLTLTEALCIIQSGWGISEVEKRLYFEASDLISKEVQRVRLENQKQLLEVTNDN